MATPTASERSSVRSTNTSEFYEPSKRDATAEQETSDGFAEAFTAASSGPSAETKGRETTDSTKTTQPEASGPTGTTKVETNDSAESMDAGVGGSSDGRERAYLKERNTVLSAKLEQREATINELQEQVETLEAELAALQSPSESDETDRDQSATRIEGDDNDSAGASVWSRVKSLVGKQT